MLHDKMSSASSVRNTTVTAGAFMGAGSPNPLGATGRTTSSPCLRMAVRCRPLFCCATFRICWQRLRVHLCDDRIGLWSSIYRDSLFPRTEYAETWKVPQRDLPRRTARRRVVEPLLIVHEQVCEAERAHLLAAVLDAGQVPDPKAPALAATIRSRGSTRRRAKQERVAGPRSYIRSGGSLENLHLSRTSLQIIVAVRHITSVRN